MDFLFGHLERVAFIMVDDKAFDPIDVRIGSTGAKVAQVCDGADPIEEFLFGHGI